MIYLMRTKERMEKSAARHKIQSNMAKRVLLYGIRKEYSLKELPAIGKGIYGKPYFPEYPEICFNYSHADAGILCGIAETPLGVDIERLIHPTERLIRAVCHENEKKMLLAIEDPAVQIRYFSKIWTAKESYLKCSEQASGRSFRIWIFPKYSMERPMRKCIFFLSGRRRFSGGQSV